MAIERIKMCYFIFKPIALASGFVGIENCGCLCSTWAVTISFKKWRSWEHYSRLRLLTLSPFEFERKGGDERNDVEVAKYVFTTAINYKTCIAMGKCGRGAC
jgi:hypothetical protein